MSESIINGIDVSEEIRYCNNCSNLGLDFKTGEFYCTLSHRPDELPEVLSCDEFSTNCYIKRLQEENKSLQMLSCANCGEKYLSPDGAELYDKNVHLQKENEELKKELERLNKECYETLKMLKLEHKGRQKDNEQWFTRCTENHNEDSKVIEKYRSVLEEIKDIAKEATNSKDCYIYMYAGRMYCEPILKKIDEVLNDRD